MPLSSRTNSSFGFLIAMMILLIVVDDVWKQLTLRLAPLNHCALLNRSSKKARKQ
jgi:hypothetical protein